MNEEMQEEMNASFEEKFEAKLAEGERIGDLQMNEYWEDYENDEIWI